MFDYARNMKLALADTMRRSALKAGAGVVMAVGAGFLLAALWSYLATELGWGSMLASLTIGGVFVVIGAIVLMMGGRVRHKTPTTDDLRAEVQARVDMVADATIGRARSEASRFADMAEARVHGLIDRATGEATRVVGQAERSVRDLAQGTVDRVTDTAEKVGLTSQNLHAAQDAAGDAMDSARQAANSNAGSMAKLAGAFGVGLALASKLQDWRRSNGRDDPPDWRDY